MARLQRRSLAEPDDTRRFAHGDVTEFSGARRFGVAPRSIGEEVLATLVFTDIVGSTATLTRIGDTAWRELLLDHMAAMRLELERHRGRELKTTGDGFLFAFDSASRAVRCAQAMVVAARAAGLGIRAGCHSGEVQLLDGDARGGAVHTAARVMDQAGEGEVFLSATTRLLLAGSDVGVESVGMRELKGIGTPLEVFRAR